MFRRLFANPFSMFSTKPSPHYALAPLQARRMQIASARSQGTHRRSPSFRAQPKTPSYAPPYTLTTSEGRSPPSHLTVVPYNSDVWVNSITTKLLLTRRREDILEVYLYCTKYLESISFGGPSQERQARHWLHLLVHPFKYAYQPDVIASCQTEADLWTAKYFAMLRKCQLYGYLQSLTDILDRQINKLPSERRTARRLGLHTAFADARANLKKSGHDEISPERHWTPFTTVQKSTPLGAKKPGTGARSNQGNVKPNASLTGGNKSSRD